MVSKVQYTAKEVQEQENLICISEYACEALSGFSSYLKVNAYCGAAAIGLIAFGTRGLNRLRMQSAQHSIRWFKNPTLPIYAGVGITMYSTLAHIIGSVKMENDLIGHREGIRIASHQLAEMKRDLKSNVDNKS